MITRTGGASNAPLANGQRNQASQLQRPVDSTIQVASYGMATVNEIADDLTVIIDPNHVVQLTALQVQEPGLFMRVTVAGYFDFGHLKDLAAAAIDLSPRAKGVYLTVNPLRPELLARITNRVQRVKKGECATIADVCHRRWLPIDFDPVRASGISATDKEKEKAIVVARTVQSHLKLCGWPDPVVVDSGNGRVLLYRVDLPTEDDGLIRNVLSGLSQAFSTAEAKVDTSTHDAIRLCRVPGTLNRKGDSNVNRPHRVCRLLAIPDTFNIVANDQLKRIVELAKPQSQTQTVASKQDNSDVISRAEIYISKIPPAVSGQSGDPQTFTVACRLVIDFDLTPDQAFPLLKKWNKNCLPPWPDRDLRRKLEEANKKEDKRGSLNRSLSNRSDAIATQGLESKIINVANESCQPAILSSEKSENHPQFCVSIPDFMQIDLRSILQPLMHSTGRQENVRTACLALVFWCMIVQKCSRVVLPDVLIAEAVWGARPWPANWRRTISHGMASPTQERIGGYACPRECSLFGTGVRHQHFVASNSQDFSGALEAFMVEVQEDVRYYNFSPRLHNLEKEERAHFKELRKSGCLGQVHMPTWIFGRSPRVGMSSSQCRLVFGLTRELTRDRSRDIGRKDRALLIVNGVVPDGSGGETVCPLLNSDQRYVTFGGNERRSGCGYRILGSTFNGWLARCGYSNVLQDQRVLNYVRKWLADLMALSIPFQLTVTGWHPRRQEWLHLSDMIDLLRSRAGRRWLSQCSVRIYAPENYALVWRQYFAARLGFSCIPGGEADKKTPIPESTQPWDRARAVKWLKDQNLSRSELAVHLKCSKSLISQQLTGTKPWSKSFAAKLQALTTKLALSSSK